MKKAGRTDTPAFRSIQAELRPVRLVPGSEYLLQIFNDLSDSRGVGMAGPLPITYLEIKAYCELVDLTLTTREVAAIKSMDSVFLGETYAS